MRGLLIGKALDIALIISLLPFLVVLILVSVVLNALGYMKK